MSLENTSKSLFVRIKKAKREILYTDHMPAKVYVNKVKYSEGELGIIDEAYSDWFYNHFNPIATKSRQVQLEIPEIKGETKSELLEKIQAYTLNLSKEIEENSTNFIVRPYYKSNGFGFLNYVYHNEDIPIILFDPTLNNLSSRLSITDNYLALNPGYFVGIFREGEYFASDESPKDEGFPYLEHFRDLFPAERFNQIPIEVMERKVSRQDKDNLLKYYTRVHELNQ